MSNESLQHSYLLIQGTPVFSSDEGTFISDLWLKDLHRHLDYISTIDLACPVHKITDPTGLVPIPKSDICRIRILPLNSECDSNRSSSLISKFLACLKITKLAFRYEIIHLTLNEAPVFYGILCPLLRYLSRTHCLMIIESTSSWRRQYGTKLKSLWGVVAELCAKSAVKHSSIAIHTSDGYHKTLGNGRHTTAVIPAAWIDDDICVTPNFIAEKFRPRTANRSLRIGFFGHLNHPKAPDLLLESIRELHERKIPVEVNLWGKGDLYDCCASYISRFHLPAELCGTLPYGPEFFEKLREYDVIVVPNRLDEQPRIILDAYSQGTPIIAASTSGIRQCAIHNETALLFDTNNSSALTQAILTFQSTPGLAKSIALNALSFVQQFSHTKMHSRRHQLLRALTPRPQSIL